MLLEPKSRNRGLKSVLMRLPAVGQVARRESNWGADKLLRNSVTELWELIGKVSKEIMSPLQRKQN